MAKAINDGKGNLNILCDSCGKPITQTNVFGMFCEDFCGLEQAKEGYAKGRKLCSELGAMLDRKYSGR